MKFPNTKFFIIFISLIALFNIFSIFSKYDLETFTKPKPPLNIFDKYILFFVMYVKYNYSYQDIKTVGFYTDVDGDVRDEILYGCQDSIMPIFIEDSTNHDYVLCFSYSKGCRAFAKDKNMEIKGAYKDIYFCKRKNKK